jgi:hypothetical protein
MSGVHLWICNWLYWNGFATWSGTSAGAILSGRFFSFSKTYPFTSPALTAQHEEFA